MSSQEQTSFIDRTFRQLRDAWDEIAPAGLRVGPDGPRADLPDEDAGRLRAQMRDCLKAVGGELSVQARAAELGRVYLSLNATGRARFLNILSAEFDIDRDAVDADIIRVQQAGESEQRRQAERDLRHALRPPRVKLLTQCNSLPEGVKFLVDMRADLIQLAKDDPVLAALESDLEGLLASWFDIGFLGLRRITWDAPAILLEKLIAYEAVHEIRGWADLKDRLDSDRRCFAYFHPSMPEEPLIFVEVALVRGMTDSVQALLDEDAPVGDAHDADTAIFYSISNAQAGLSGISFGGFLIKRVADHLAAEFKGLRTFATLSPIPGFMRWLGEQLDLAGEGGADPLLPVEWRTLSELPAPVTDPASFKALLALAQWPEDETLSKALKGLLMRLCARYLVDARRPDGRGARPGGALSPVQWRADGAVELDGRYLGGRAATVRRHDAQLPVPARGHRRESRGLFDPGEDRDLVGNQEHLQRVIVRSAPIAPTVAIVNLTPVFWRVKMRCCAWCNLLAARYLARFGGYGQVFRRVENTSPACIFRCRCRHSSFPGGKRLGT